MALAPYIFRDFLNDDFLRPSRLLDQHFGVGLCPEDLLEPFTFPASRGLLHNNSYFRPWRSALAKLDQGSTVSCDKDKFQVQLDVQQFAPNEITVKTVDNAIVVEGKHEEKKDEHGFISRHFVRRYMVPPGHDPKDIVSSLSSDGVLTVTAPKNAIEDKSERTVPITHTGPAKEIGSGDQKKGVQEKIKYYV